jgi:hypothetical protein
VAVKIALHNRVGMSIIREWSEREGMLDRYAEFVKALASARRARAPGRRPQRPYR